MPKLSAGQFIVIGVFLFLAVSAVVDVVTSIGNVDHSSSHVTAQLGGAIGSFGMVVGHQSKLVLNLNLSSGTEMSPACVGGNLSPEFRVTKVTYLGSPGTAWKDNESCGGILETSSTVPVVISVVPLHAGDFDVRLVPKVRLRTVGSALKGDIRVSS